MRILCFLLLVCMILLCLIGPVQSASAASSDDLDVWMFVTNVGKGDAIFLSVNGAVCLIDTGYPHVRGKLMTAMDYLGIKELQSVIVTHTDKDHVGGLEWLAASDIPVGKWYASAYYMDVKEKKHPLNVAAMNRGSEAIWVKAGDEIPLGPAVLKVLAPVEEAFDKDDNNSLVMCLSTNQGTILLAGDMENEEEETLLDTGVSLKADVLKVGNHGDNDATGKAFAQEVSPGLSVISTSSVEKPGTPDPKVVSRLKNLGSAVVTTEEASLGILIRLSDRNATAQGVDLPATSPLSDVRIASVDADQDMTVLENTGKTDIDLTDAYLYSDKGSELFVFPAGTVIHAGGTLSVGTYSTKNQSECDVIWPDKKVIHASKSDIIQLYDAGGRMVSSMENGL